MSPKDRVLGALVGLANAIDGNETMVNDETMALVFAALESPVDSEAMRIRIHREKARISPGCAACQHPCGRTSDFDMDLLSLEAAETRILKLQLIDQLRKDVASPASMDRERLFRRLRAIGEYWDEAGLMKLLQ